MVAFPNVRVSLGAARFTPRDTQNPWLLSRCNKLGRSCSLLARVGTCAGKSLGAGNQHRVDKTPSPR